MKNQAPNNFNKCQAQKATNMIKTMRVKATTIRTTVETREAQDSEAPMTNLEKNTVAEEGMEAMVMEVGTTIITKMIFNQGTTKMEKSKDHTTKSPTATMVSKDSRGKETFSTIESSTSNQKSTRTQTTAGFTAVTTIFSSR